MLSDKHDTSSHVTPRGFAQHVTTFSYAKMHGLESVSCRDATSGIWDYAFIYTHEAGITTIHDILYVQTRGVPNSGFRLFGRIRIRIRIALLAEHFDAAPVVLIFTTSLCPSLITAVPAYCLDMTLSSSFVSHIKVV